MKKLTALLLISLTLTGCSQFLYKNGQNYQKSKCLDEAITPEQREYCETIDNKSYKDYQKERSAL